MTLEVRNAVPADIPRIFKFICDLAEYEKALSEVKCSPESLTKSLFCPAPTAFALMIEDGLQPIGYAIYFFNYSTWRAAKGLYLEDLYIDSAHRGKGAGMLLMKTLAAKALEQGCKRFEWSVLDWNTPSIEFYERLGAKAQSEWIGYRLEDGALQKLAESPS